MSTMRWSLLFLVAFLAGCFQMIESDVINEEEHSASCDSDGVGYHLPRRKVELSVHLLTGATPNRYTLTLSKKLVPVGSTGSSYCLRYAGGVFSSERIAAEITNEGLLHRVYSHAEDQGKSIVLKLIDSATALAASETAGRMSIGGWNGQRSTGVLHIGSFVVDPFDQSEMEAVNSTLRQYGYCVHLDGSGDDHVPTWSAAQCLENEGKESRRPLEKTERARGLEEAPPRHAPKWGVLYKPNLAHRLLILYRDDHQPTASWLLDQAHVLELPNAAPVFAVDVRRAFLADRQTTLTFDQGVLEDVTIEKDSELNALADIPLRVAQFVVSIPAQIVQLRINRTSNAREVIEANQLLLESYRLTREMRSAQILLLSGEELCRSAAEQVQITERSMNAYLHVCVSKVNECRQNQTENKSDEQCALDYWSDWERKQNAS